MNNCVIRIDLLNTWCILIDLFRTLSVFAVLIRNSAPYENPCSDQCDRNEAEDKIQSFFGSGLELRNQSDHISINAV